MPEVMEKVSYARQLDIFNPEDYKNVHITVIGAGSVGSFVVLALAKMGIQSIEVWDDDTVEVHNIPNQFYPLASVGAYKVEALASFVEVMTGVSIYTHKVRFTGSVLLPGIRSIIISAVDSLDVRRDLWKSIKTKEKPELYIDARMGGELMRIFAVRNSRDFVYYEDSLKGEAVALPCTARSIVFNVLPIGGIVAALVKKHLKKELVHKEVIFDMRNFIFMATK